MSVTPSQPPTLDAITSAEPGYDPHALPVAAAQSIIERYVRPVEAIESVAVRAALDRVLAQDLTSPIDVPAHDNAAMDGYAVRADDVADGLADLSIVGSALAGHPYDGSVSAGTAVRIMTGAVMPAGADTVVPQEVAQADGERVRIDEPQQAGQHRRLRGEDLSKGRTALAAGKHLLPADLGLIASLGFAEVPVRRRPRVAFFSTGSELRSVGQSLEAGQIYDSNRYTLYGMLERAGVQTVDMGIVPDDRAALEHAMTTAAASADAIISSGGVSVGEADFTREIMSSLGDVRFWTIAMRPGRPMAFGRVHDTLYFGLPGNPVAVMITFYFFVRPALARLAGAEARLDPLVRARALTPFRKRPGRTEYQRGRLSRGADGSMQVMMTGSQGSGVLRSMSQADCIVLLHHEQGSVAAGDFVDCVPYHGLV